ncbi:RNA-directed DNA polymerase [Brevundimonas sp. NIBR11]|uniref:RNA-directed DNA polymerase n=1 Tax=Brevundimonas sp. NIBR11 TaxID=3015999 RepID=UPI0022F0EC8C|nr:RNA-directed DNA polymerase [Brevundimonas sp. NIBR11]WGM32480.1 hypothetical protein KKHFBJBL_02732 [Brevundimonas sp. NIBR11]
MTENRKYEWAEVSLEDMLLAYRKCKADCFYERSLYATEAFIEYEKELTNNITRLQIILHSGEVSSLFSQNLGTPRVFAKKLSLDRRGDNPTDHSFFSDSNRAFGRLGQDYDLVPEFRLVGEFPVDFHILSALWINTVGCRYDAKLRSNAYGSRLRRYGERHDMVGRPTDGYHEESVGSFEPYFKPYKAWRDQGMQAIKNSLAEGQSVIALTLDFSSYYHNVDPTFMTDPRFLDAIGLRLNSWEIEFTNTLVYSLMEWGYLAQATLSSGTLQIVERGGLPIGSSAVRIIANVLLIELDEIIKHQLNPIFYGRYVDDIFLVLNDPGNINSSDQLWQFISDRADAFKADHITGEVSIELPGGYQGSTRLAFQTQKQKIFFLSGQSGLDLLASIAHQIRSLSSERRLMPLPEELEAAASARVLAASETTAEDADSFRRADGLTIRRLGWALQLRSVEILGRDLPADTWKPARERFYAFARAHILRPDKILEQIDYLPRLLSLAISLADWEEAAALLRAAHGALDQLRILTASGSCRINGVRLDQTSDDIWSDLKNWINHSCRDAVIRSFPWDRRTGKPLGVTRRGGAVLASVGLTRSSAHELALAARETDLAKTPFKEHLRLDASAEPAPKSGEDLLEESYRNSGELREFLQKTRGEEPGSGVRRINVRCETPEGTEGSMMPYLAPTRPYTAQEIALYLPDECVFGAVEETTQALAGYLRAIRGVWSRRAGELTSDYAPYDDIDEVPPGGRVAILGETQGELRLGITSLLTTDAAWSKGAAGAVDLSPERYRRLATIVNLAVKADPRPTHLLLPEVSLPEAWLGTLSGVLLEARISLIAGLDYDHYTMNRVSSSAVMVLTDGRLGYPSAVQVRQPKILPAPGEEEALHVMHGKTWRDWGDPLKPIYIHNGCHFGVLICSELQNMNYRKSFQGNVDLVSILSWNKDLDTFSALIESASLDVHAYIAVVNNRHYGDSRVRAPAKMSFARDVCRIRGGENDHLVVVRVDPSHLRAQQSRAQRWPRHHDRYKPTPEGFVLKPSRYMTPS